MRLGMAYRHLKKNQRVERKVVRTQARDTRAQLDES